MDKTINKELRDVCRSREIGSCKVATLGFQVLCLKNIIKQSESAENRIEIVGGSEDGLKDLESFSLE